MEVWGINIMASIMIVFIIIVRSLGLYKLPKYIFIWLWGLVIIRLLLPVSISLPISIPMELSNPIVGFYERETSVKKNSDKQINNSMDENGNTVILSEYDDLQQFNYLEIINGIRTIGTFVFLILFLISLSRSFYKIRDSLPADSEEIKKWQQCTKLKIYRPLEIRMSDRIGSPLTMGIIKPKIIIPTTIDLTDKNSLDYMLMHEFIHVKRFDIFLKTVLNIIVCYYWYNPLIWVMFILCNRDIELACDEKVISIFGKENRTEYAHVLLTMSEKRNGMLPTYVGFGKTAIKERIGAIMKYRKKTIKGMLMAGIIMIGITSLFITSNAAILEDNQKEIDIQTDEDWAQYFANLSGYGLTFDEQQQQLYYKEIPIKAYADNLLEKGSNEFKGIFYNCKEGDSCIRPIKNTNGEIIDVELIPEEELKLGTAGFTINPDVDNKAYEGADEQ